MRDSKLTQREKELISKIGCDLQTGNHFLFPRTKEYWEFHKTMHDAVEAKEPTEKQKDILEYYRQCTDYYYWKNLPDEEKMY